MRRNQSREGKDDTKNAWSLLFIFFIVFKNLFLDLPLLRDIQNYLTGFYVCVCICLSFSVSSPTLPPPLLYILVLLTLFLSIHLSQSFPLLLLTFPTLPPSHLPFTASILAGYWSLAPVRDALPRLLHSAPPPPSPPPSSQSVHPDRSTSFPSSFDSFPQPPR